MKKRWVIVVGLLVALVGGCASDAPNEQTASDGTLSDPIQRQLEAVQSSPRSAEAHGKLGLAYEMGGRLGAARESYLRAAELDASGGRWAYLAALARGESGDLEGALEELRAVQPIASGYLALPLYQGRWLLDLGRIDEAGEAYTRASKIDANEPAVWIGIARVHLKSDRPAEAVELLTRLLANEPDEPYIYQLLGQAYRKLGDLESARAALARAKPDAGPTWPDPWHNERMQYRAGYGGGMLRAAELMKQGKVAEATAVMETLREQDPNDRQLINNLSVAYRNLGQPDRAFEVLQDGLERHPDYYPFHFNISADYQRMQQFENALVHLQRAAEINPGFALAHERIGNIYLMQGQQEPALAAFLEAARTAPDKPAYRLYSGAILQRLGRWSESIEQLERATELDPSSAAAWIPLGQAFAEVGRYDEAEAALQRAQQLSPNSEFLARAWARLQELRGGS